MPGRRSTSIAPSAWPSPFQTWSSAVVGIGGRSIRRASPVRLGPGQRNRIHPVAANRGYDRSASYWTGPGRGWLAELDLPAASREIVTDCLAVIDGLAPVIERLDGELHQHAKADPRVKVLRTLPGVGNSPRWSWSRRSATSAGSPAPGSWPPGPG